MERARFFHLLHLARAFKAKGYDGVERFGFLYWFSGGYALGWYASGVSNLVKEE